MNNPFARGLACADENEQAAFLNAFAEELRAVCKTGHGWDAQCCYVGRHLHEGAREVFGALVEYGKLAVEERQKAAAYSDGVLRDIDTLEQRKAHLEKEVERLEGEAR